MQPVHSSAVARRLSDCMAEAEADEVEVEVEMALVLMSLT
jgi:hypothetical protein